MEPRDEAGCIINLLQSLSSRVVREEEKLDPEMQNTDLDYSTVTLLHISDKWRK